MRIKITAPHRLTGDALESWHDLSDHLTLYGRTIAGGGSTLTGERWIIVEVDDPDDVEAIREEVEARGIGGTTIEDVREAP